MMRGGIVYMMANRAYGVLYVGVTADIAARVHQHKIGQGSRFCRLYGIDQLVLVEQYPTIDEAIKREKQLKHWERVWKINLIEDSNPDWEDLSNYHR